MIGTISKPTSMGIRVPRKKKRVLLLSLLYRLHRILPVGTRTKLRWYLDLEWIFDRLAMETSFRYYAPQDHPFRRSQHRFILRRIGRENVVLDLGCNAGDLTVVIAGKAGEVVGVDHDAVVIARAKREHQAANLTFHHIDALDFLRSTDKRFDTLILSHILEHLDDPEEFLGRFKQYFQQIYIELPDFDKTYLNHYRRDVGTDLIHTDDDHVSEFDRDELTGMLARKGISVVDAEYRFGIQRLWCRVDQS